MNFFYFSIICIVAVAKVIFMDVNWVIPDKLFVWAICDHLLLFSQVNGRVNVPESMDKNYLMYLRSIKALENRIVQLEKILSEFQKHKALQLHQKSSQVTPYSPRMIRRHRMANLASMPFATNDHIAQRYLVTDNHHKPRDFRTSRDSYQTYPFYHTYLRKPHRHFAF